jgi:hypothetical protein
MSTSRTICFWMICGFLVMAASNAHADVVYYKLDNVILDDNTQMTGTFSWTFDVGDFENGDGEFISLDIPWTDHDHTDLIATIDPTESIEITLGVNTDSDGVDITLVLVQPLTPTTSSLINLVQTESKNESKYQIGPDRFLTGFFDSGNILLIPEPCSLGLLALGGLALIKRRRR